MLIGALHSLLATVSEPRISTLYGRRSVGGKEDLGVRRSNGPWSRVQERLWEGLSLEETVARVGGGMEGEGGQGTHGGSHGELRYEAGRQRFGQVLGLLQGQVDLRRGKQTELKESQTAMTRAIPKCQDVTGGGKNRRALTDWRLWCRWLDE